MEALCILTLVGKVLLAFGAIRTAFSAYNLVGVMQSVNASWLPWHMWIFSIDFPDLLLGFFLLRGSLRAAGITMWFLISVVTAALFEPLIQLTQPAELLYTKLAVYPTQVMKDSALWALPTVVYLWVMRELMRNPVLSARAEAKGKRLIPLMVPLLLTLAVYGATIVVLALSFTNDMKSQTQAFVEKKIGAGYKYYMRPTRVMWSQLGKFYDVEVTAYKGESILVIPVHAPDSGNSASRPQ
jgi:hypothetical protein